MWDVMEEPREAGVAAVVAQTPLDSMRQNM